MIDVSTDETSTRILVLVLVLFDCKRNKYILEGWRIGDQLDVTSYEVLFHFFYAQHVSDINTSIIRSLRVAGCSLLHGYHPNPATQKLQNTSKQEHTTNVVIQ